MNLPLSGYRSALFLAVVAITWLATTPLQVPVVEDIHDKVNHIAAFLVLAWLFDLSFPARRFGWAKAGTLLGYGVLIEVVQYFLPYRSFSLLDIVADGAGIAIYAILLPALRRFAMFRLRDGVSRQ